MGMGMNDVPSSQKEIIRLKGAVSISSTTKYVLSEMNN